MGRSAQGAGCRETRIKPNGSGTARILPLPHCTLQVPAVDRVPGELTQDCYRENSEKRIAQKVLERTGTKRARIYGAQLNLLRFWREIEFSAMDDLVQFAKDKDVPIITNNNPPVNALSPGVAKAIAQTIAQVGDDDGVKAVVLIGGGRTFIAGADIKEFGKITSGKTQRGAGLLPLLLQIEDVRKPVVVAMHGSAFGGGLELAMAGHYRVAAPNAQLGPPEVKLGIIPGAGGPH